MNTRKSKMKLEFEIGNVSEGHPFQYSKISEFYLVQVWHRSYRNQSMMKPKQKPILMRELSKSNRSFKMMLSVYKRRKIGTEGDKKKRKKELKGFSRRRRRQKDWTYKEKSKVIVSKQLHRLANNPFS